MSLKTDPRTQPMQRRKWPDDYIDTSDGIRCPKCRCPRTRVDYTRHKPGAMNVRRRTCELCGRQFITYERTQ